MTAAVGKYERVNGQRSDVVVVVSADEDPKPMNKYVIAAAILASLNSILLGYDVGVMSGAILFIQEDLKVSEWQIELLVGILNIVSLVGAAIAGRTSDAIGRRLTMAYAALIFTLGAAVMGIAPNYSILMCGRLLAGVGVGFALMIAPIYTAELAPSSSRGALGSLPEIFINAGILLGYISNYFLADLPVHVSWRLMLGLGAAPSVFLGLAVLAMPESPRWLVMQRRIPEAMTVLSRTSSDDNEAYSRLVQIMEAAGISSSDMSFEATDGENKVITNYPVPNGVVKSENEGGEGIWKELILRPSKPVRWMLLVALGLQFFQQASGIDATVYYSPVVFREAGIKSKNGILRATIAVGVAKTAFILVATFLIDKLGRRQLLLTSAVGMTSSLLVLSMGFFFLESSYTSHKGGAAILAIVAVCSNVSFFSIGMGPVNWVINSEIFPLKLRAQAGGLGVVVNRVVSGVVSMSFLSLSSGITVAGTFLVFALVSLSCSLFIYLFVPETKGRSLEEIAEVFGYKDDNSYQPQEVELGDTVSLVRSG